MEKGQPVFVSPYVARIERFADSMKHLSQAVLTMEEEKHTFTGEEVEGMFEQVRKHVCGQCEKCSWCWGEQAIHTCQLGYEILSAVERDGAEINKEMRQRLRQYCLNSAAFLREMLLVFQDAKQKMMWNNRLAMGREGSAHQINAFAEMLCSTARDLEQGMVVDARMERKMLRALKRRGVRMLHMENYMNENGRYEVRLTLRSMGKKCVAVKEVEKEVSQLYGRRFDTLGCFSPTLCQEYRTFHFREIPSYYTLQGVARIAKGCNEISGDNFSMMELSCGKQGAALSDGMGSGKRACRESTMVIELLEELLEAGVPEKTAISMINTTLVMGREEIHYSTVDMSVFNLYTGECELIKAGASSTFIKRGTKVEQIRSTSLPLGVVNKLEVDSVTRKLEDGDFVIMMTDGVMDALPVGEQDLLLETIIGGTTLLNPKEMAHHILQQALNWTGKEPGDDMTVLVVGLWKMRRRKGM